MQESCVCRICLCRIELSSGFLIHHYSKTQNFEKLQIRDIIAKCIPELDLEITDNPMICSFCYDLLISTSIFKSKCIQTEEKIYDYLEANNLKLGDKINLNNLVNSNFTISNVKVEVDAENSPKIVKVDLTDEVIMPKFELTETKEDIIHISEFHGKEIEPDVDISEVIDKESGHEQSEIEESKSCNKSIYEKRQYTCARCEYKGVREDLLKKHLKKCRKVKAEFYCNDCSYKTFRKRHLKRHSLIHGGERPYICDLCKKGYTEKYLLKTHIYNKHTGEDLPFKCREGNCTSTFKRNCDLKAHITRRHFSLNRIICEFCGKEFSNHKKRRSHLRTCSKNT